MSEEMWFTWASLAAFVIAFALGLLANRWCDRQLTDPGDDTPPIEAKIERFTVLDLTVNDRLIVVYPDPISPEGAERMTEGLQRYLNHKNVLVLDSGPTIGVVRCHDDADVAQQDGPQNELQS